MNLQFRVLSMPGLTLGGVCLLLLSSILAFCFTCQPNFSHEHDKDAVFRTDQLLTNKFENMLIFRSENIFTLFPRKPGLSENY